MKKLLIYTLSIFLWISCNKDNMSLDDRHISLSEVSQFIPNSIKKNDFAVFRTASAEEWKLSISYDEFPGEHQLKNGASITMDTYYIQMNSSDEQKNIDIQILGDAFINEDVSVIKPNLYCALMKFHTSGGVSMNIAVGSQFIPNQYTALHENIELNGRSFNNVYSIIQNEKSSFSELYYNTEQGIVGFKDINNVLWHLINYE